MSIGFIYFFIFSKIRVQYLHTATAVIIHLFSHSQTLCLWHKFAISPFCYRSYHSLILPLANFVPTAQICHISILLPQYGDIIAPRNDCMIPNAFYTPLQTITAFGCLVPGTYLSVIQRIFCTHCHRRQIWHKNISSCQNTKFTSPWMNGRQRCCRWKQYIRLHNTQQTQQI